MSAVAKSITCRALDLAVTGMDASLDGISGLAAFQNWVYSPAELAGIPVFDSFTADLLAETCLAGLRDAGLPAGARIALILLESSPAISISALAERLSVSGLEVVSNGTSQGPFGSTFGQAQDLLDTGQAEVVVLCTLANGPAMVVLEKGAQAAQRRAAQYASVHSSAWAVSLAGPADETLRAACAQSMHLALTLPPLIGLLEISGADPGALPGILAAYQLSPKDLTCALSTLILDHPSPLHSLIKTCLCLSRRFIPGINPGRAQDLAAGCAEAPFYLPETSRAWFRRRLDPPRAAGLAVLEELPSHLILHEPDQPRKETPEPLVHMDPRIFLLSAESPQLLADRLEDLQAALDHGEHPTALSSAAASEWSAARGELTLALLASTPAELAREIGFARKGMSKSFETGADWQTPAGSYLTPRPLGRDGKVAFVYPGAFNSYTGAGKDLLYYYPRVFQHLDRLSANAGRVLRERLLYPRSRSPLTQADQDALDAQLAADAVTMLSSGTTLSVMYTLILQDYYKIQPGCAFGYSLGETSMLFAFQVWANGDVSESVLYNSSLFRDRLAGPQNTVRERWGLPALPAGTANENLWANHIIMAAPEIVAAAIQSEERVYLTHINTPRQVVIGGDPAACQRVIEAVRAPALRAPFDHVLHCAAMAGEYDTLVEMNTWPVYQTPTLPLYSAAGYSPLDIDPHETARSIAAMLCAPLDFPRLTRLAYDNGARLFVELGAGSNCARWISETLKDQPHAAFSMDRKGLDDGSAILRAVARLISHAVPIDPTCMFSETLSPDRLRIQTT